MKPTSLIVCLAFIFAICVAPLRAAEDAYHAALRNQLQQSGITGGTWVFSDQESQDLGLIQPTNVSSVQKSWSGPEPFTRTLELTTSSAAPNPWDSAVRFPTRASIARGDVLLLVIWIRGIQANQEAGYITHIFEQTSSPYTKSVALNQAPATVWQQWMIPFQAEVDYPAGQGRYQINMGLKAQKIEIAGLAVLNFRHDYTKSQLPKSKYHLDYPGQAADAPWRAAALARIDEIRKAPLTVRVVDLRGAPLPGASVRVEMKRHAFGFGTALAVSRMLGTSPDDELYRQRIFNLNGDGKTWSIIVFENALKWPDWENDNWEGTKQQVVGVTKSLRDAGIRVKGHNLVWPSFDYLPADLKEHSTDAQYVRSRIADHILEEAGYTGLKGQICEWDVINEPAHLFELKNLFGGEQIYADWFKLAAQADPDARLYINEYSIISAGGLDVSSQTRYRGIIEGILANGGRIDGIGVQGHMDATLTGPEKVLEVFDQFSGYGARLSVTEFDAAGADEEIMGDYMRDLLITCFSHPQVEGFLMWGFWDGAHWYNDAPVFRQDWSLKPSGQAFLNTVFNEFWTSSSGVSDGQGRFEVRGFLGDYEITATYAGHTAVRSWSLEKDGPACTIGLATQIQRPARYRSTTRP